MAGVRLSSRGRIVVYLILLLIAFKLLLGHGSFNSVSKALDKGGSTPPNQDGQRPGSSTQHSVEKHRKKELVFSALRKMDLSWVDEKLPDWFKNVYRVDMSSEEADLTVPRNKGNEAMVYLTYLIDRYWTLPDVIVFMHGERYQWHNDNPLYDSVISIKDLKLDHVRESGYANLRCTWTFGCPAELHPAQMLRDRPYDDGQGGTPENYPWAFKKLFPGIEVPEVVAAPCCGQFAISRESVHKHKQEQYIMMRQWLLDTELSNEDSGRIFEYSWHILFGKPAQYCPVAKESYCQTYGYCDMTELELMQQWIWRGPVLPAGWPDV